MAEGTLVVEDRDDLELPENPEEADLADVEVLVAADALVDSPLLVLDIDELLVPAVLDIEPIPLLEVEPLARFLGV